MNKKTIIAFSVAFLSCFSYAMEGLGKRPGRVFIRTKSTNQNNPVNVIYSTFIPEYDLSTGELDYTGALTESEKTTITLNQPGFKDIGTVQEMATLTVENKNKKSKPVDVPLAGAKKDLTQNAFITVNTDPQGNVLAVDVTVGDVPPIEPQRKISQKFSAGKLRVQNNSTWKALLKYTLATEEALPGETDATVEYAKKNQLILDPGSAQVLGPIDAVSDLTVEPYGKLLGYASLGAKPIPLETAKKNSTENVNIIINTDLVGRWTITEEVNPSYAFELDVLGFSMLEHPFDAFPRVVSKLNKNETIYAHHFFDIPPESSLREFEERWEELNEKYQPEKHRGNTQVAEKVILYLGDAYSQIKDEKENNKKPAPFSNQEQLKADHKTYLLASKPLAYFEKAFAAFQKGDLVYPRDILGVPENSTLEQINDAQDKLLSELKDNLDLEDQKELVAKIKNLILSAAATRENEIRQELEEQPLDNMRELLKDL